MKSFHHAADRKCGIFLSVVAECCRTESIKKKKKACVRRRDPAQESPVSKSVDLPYGGRKSTDVPINNPLTLTFIKSFLRLIRKKKKKMTVKLIIHLIMVMPPYYPCPCFPPLSLLLQKHINQKGTQRTPASQCTGGYPLTILTRLKFKFLLTFQFPQILSSGVRK